jgi:hypothetical protein
LQFKVINQLGEAVKVAQPTVYLLTAAPPPPLDKPVWLHLDRLYGEPDEDTAPFDDRPPGGLVKATGRVPGLLKRWTRAVDGRWFGKVDFSVCDSCGFPAASVDVMLLACRFTPRTCSPCWSVVPVGV